jgi:preprotein translocase subunit YajC
VADADKGSAPPNGTTTATTGTPSPSGPPPGGSGDQLGNPLWNMAPMLAAMFIFFWLFIIRPEKKRQKAKQDLLSSIKVKDKVVTIFGLYGTVVDFDGDDVILNVDPKKDVKIRMRRSAIDGVVEEEKKEEKK